MIKINLFTLCNPHFCGFRSGTCADLAMQAKVKQKFSPVVNLLLLLLLIPYLYWLKAGFRLNCIITTVRLRETRRFRSGQVFLRSGQVDFQRTCPTGQVVEKVNVEPCTPVNYCSF